MAILKLKDAGDTTTLTITRCEVKAGNFSEQVAFSAGEDVLFVNKDTADRQLLRCGFDVGDYAAVVGATLRFSREANVKKPGAAPFWNIEISSPGEAKQTAAPSKRIAPPTRVAKPVVNAFDAMVPPDDLTDADYPPSWDDVPHPADALPMKPSATPAKAVAAVDADVASYCAVMQQVAAQLGCAVTEPNVQGATATLWIQWHRR